MTDRGAPTAPNPPLITATFPGSQISALLKPPRAPGAPTLQGPTGPPRAEAEHPPRRVHERRPSAPLGGVPPSKPPETPSLGAGRRPTLWTPHAPRPLTHR